MLLANRTKAKAEALAGRIGAAVSGNEMIAKEADLIFLGVKPQMMGGYAYGHRPRAQRARQRPRAREHGRRG